MPELSPHESSGAHESSDSQASSDESASIGEDTIARLLEAALSAALYLREKCAQGAGEVRRKEDGTEVTDADLAADEKIREHLSPLATSDGIEIVSEETGGNASARFLLVDPLDGTRNFTTMGHDFCVNIGLVEGDRATFGVIADPSASVCWWGGVGYGAWRASFSAGGVLGNKTTLRVRNAESPIRGVIGYWSNEAIVKKRLTTFGLQNVSFAQVGAALKFCRIAEGKADLYPRGAGSSEWDTAAGQAILEAAGGMVRIVGADGMPSSETLRYGKEKFLNPPFLATTKSVWKE